MRLFYAKMLVVGDRHSNAKHPAKSLISCRWRSCRPTVHRLLLQKDQRCKMGLELGPEPSRMEQREPSRTGPEPTTGERPEGLRRIRHHHLRQWVLGRIRHHRWGPQRIRRLHRRRWEPRRIRRRRHHHHLRNLRRRLRIHLRSRRLRRREAVGVVAGEEERIHRRLRRNLLRSHRRLLRIRLRTGVVAERIHRRIRRRLRRRIRLRTGVVGERIHRRIRLRSVGRRSLLRHRMGEVAAGMAVGREVGMVEDSIRHLRRRLPDLRTGTPQRRPKARPARLPLYTFSLYRRK